jgi:hypothetical protein
VCTQSITREHRELAEIHLRAVRFGGQFLGWRGRVRRNHAVERVEQVARFADGFALHRIGHQRCGRLRDRAALSLEGGVLDHVAIEGQIERQAIAAERVVALLLRRRRVDDAKVMRPAIVIEDHFLVKVVKF